ncbi:hypothetical protein ColLi_12997 [Colletotrichum liriopes]|uniref:Uncharacterized protein n=1 Tax=Colletotrichum liriopes TaxID=708192 RepID=A0AA37LZ99_9PEZI|nr:hypothetical protein ColLi_12997 [Colletotrichum liriopes]
MALKRENQMLRDLLSQLTAMPEDVAHQTLKKLKFAVDPFAALRSIRPSGPKDPGKFCLMSIPTSNLNSQGGILPRTLKPGDCRVSRCRRV